MVRDGEYRTRCAGAARLFRRFICDILDLSRRETSVRAQSLVRVDSP